MEDGAGCLSSNLPGPGLLIDSYLILKGGSLLLGEVEGVMGCSCLQGAEQLSVSYVSLLLLGIIFPSRSLSMQGYFQEKSIRNCTLSQSQ